MPGCFTDIAYIGFVIAMQFAEAGKIGIFKKSFASFIN